MNTLPIQYARIEQCPNSSIFVDTYIQDSHSGKIYKIVELTVTAEEMEMLYAHPLSEFPQDVFVCPATTEEIHSIPSTSILKGTVNLNDAI